MLTIMREMNSITPMTALSRIMVSNISEEDSCFLPSAKAFSLAPSCVGKMLSMMSRKIMQLPNHPQDTSRADTNGYPPSISSASSRGSTEERVPTKEAGNLEPPVAGAEELRRASNASSFNSDEMAGMPEYLNRFSRDGATPDDDFDGDSPAPQRYGFAVTADTEIEAQRRQQQEDEQTSLFLSKRAELILANAKKRLNVRDVVRP